MFIESLNQWGRTFLQFAWPMLWQSSLLIIVLFAVDFLFRRKIRAAIRYALWLVVLLKLCLPPTLALPTGAAWWLFPAEPAKPAPIPKYVVTYNQSEVAVPMESVPQTMPLFVPPPPKLDGIGWALVGFGTVSAALAIWLTIRWWQISRKVRRATASDKLTGPLAEIQAQAKLRSPLRLKLVEGRMSPAVCGLFRPVILLPRVLVERLSAGQLRAVLLHEAFHLRRRDVWVNCAQALLQIAYWWHPLLWLANARIRRLREEAVDDAVMLALSGEAESYAPTLLEVAKLALNRPLLSLGLVGIMESRSALRKRIERLVDFRPPRKAGLTLLSLCGIFAFSAVAVPMGQGPASKPDSLPADEAAANSNPVQQDRPQPEIQIKARFVAVPKDGLAEFEQLLISSNTVEGNWVGVIAGKDLPQALQSLEAQPDAENLGEPEAVTTSGRHTQMRQTQIINVITNYALEDQSEAIVTSGRNTQMRATQIINVVPDMTKVEAGSIFDVVPTVLPDGQTIDLKTIASRLEFFGYADPTGFAASATNSAGQVIHLPASLPAIELSRASTDIELLDRQTLVLLPQPGQVVFSQPNNEREERVAQHIRQVKEKRGAQVLVVLATVTLVDAAGNPIHPADQLSAPGDPSAQSDSASASDASPAEKVPTPSDSQSVLIESRMFWMPAVHVESLVADLNTEKGQNGDATNWTISPEHFSAFDQRVNALDVQPFSTTRIQTGSGTEAELFCGIMPNGVHLDCRPVVTGGRIELAFKAKIIGDPAGEDQTLVGTNEYEIHGRAATEDGGGIFIRALNLDGLLTNLVMVLRLQIVANTPSAHPNQRLAAIVDRQNGMTSEVQGNGGAQLLPPSSDPPPNPNALAETNLIHTGPGREAIFNQLNRERLESVHYDHLSLSDVVRNLDEQAKVRDPDKTGINFLINPNPELNPATGLPEAATAAAEETPVDQVIINTNLTDVRLADVLDGIVMAADHPIKYDVTDYGIVFSSRNTNLLYLRTFKIDPKVFYDNLGVSSASFGSTNTHVGLASNVSVAARNFFTTLGVNMLVPPGKSVFFNDRLGLLFVRATESDLDTIERAIVALNSQAPPPVGAQTNADDSSPTNILLSASDSTAKAGILVQDGKLLYEMGKLDAAEDKLKAAMQLDPDNVGASYYLNLIQQAKFRREAATHAVDTPTANNALPVPNAFAQTNLVHTGPGREAIFNQLNRERLESVYYDHLPLSEVLRNLDEQVRLSDPDKIGINFLINPNPDGTVGPGATTVGGGGSGFGGGTVPTVNPATGLPLAATAAAEETPVDQVIVNLKFNDVRLADLLDAIVIVADHPIKYDVTDYGIVFSSRNTNQPQFYMRTFRVDPNLFYSGLKSVSAADLGSITSTSTYAGGSSGGGNAQAAVNPLNGTTGGQAGQGGLRYITQVTLASEVSVAARTFFTTLGVNMLDPPGKSVFFNDRLGLLFVRATEQDLDTIERAIDALNRVAPEVQIKASFIEMDQPDNNALGFDWYMGNFINGSVVTNGGTAPSLIVPGFGANPLGSFTFPGSSMASQILPAAPGQHPTNAILTVLTGILTDSNFRQMLRALESNNGAENLGQPMAVMASGRQTQMRATQIIAITNSIPLQVEVGPILDVVPYVLADGYTINLTLIPSLTEFDGYATASPIPNVASGPNAVQLPVVLPEFTVRQVVTTVNVWDNQTAVLNFAGQPDSTTKVRKEFIVFVTATIVDQAGNRVHSDDELPFAKNGVPTQPAIPPQPPN